MMMSEFIERTGFEPTGEEYAEIEAEYMGCNEDKDTFCKRWKKHHGAERLMRMRARRIEELEQRLITQNNEWAKRLEEMEKSRARVIEEGMRNAQKVTDLKVERAAQFRSFEELSEKYEKLVNAIKIIKEVES